MAYFGYLIKRNFAMIGPFSEEIFAIFEKKLSDHLSVADSDIDGLILIQNRKKIFQQLSYIVQNIDDISRTNYILDFFSQKCQINRQTTKYIDIVVINFKNSLKEYFQEIWTQEIETAYKQFFIFLNSFVDKILDQRTEHQLGEFLGNRYKNQLEAAADTYIEGVLKDKLNQLIQLKIRNHYLISSLIDKCLSDQKSENISIKISDYCEQTLNQGP